MGEPSLAYASGASAPALNRTVSAAGAVGRAGIWEMLEDLDAQELRLYALGWGDHLPIELLDRIETLYRRRLALERQIVHYAR